MNPTHDQLWSVFPLHHTPHSWLAFDKFGAQLGGLPHTSFTGDKKSSSRMRGSKIIRVHVRLYSILRYKTFRTNLHRLLCALQSDRVTGVALLLSSIDLYRSIFNSVLSSELTVKQIRSISRSTGQQGHVTCDPWPACSQKRCICKRFFLLSLANQETALNDVIVTTLVGLREVWMQSREVDEIRTVFIIIII